MKLFSERYNYTKASDVIVREQITEPIQNAICTCYDKLENTLRFASINHVDLYTEMEKYLWVYFLNRRERDFYRGNQHYTVATEVIENESIQWYKKLDLIELSILFLNRLEKEPYKRINALGSFVSNLNSHFERLNFAYRVVDKKIVEITSKYEISTIEVAIKESPSNIKLHLTNALELYAKRPKGDYRNSIKESISAVEAFCREKTGKNSFGDALDELKKRDIIIPKMLQEAFKKLYAYTNQPENGIRHALLDEEGEYIPASEDAMFMLVSCSAFVNYLNKKISK